MDGLSGDEDDDASDDGRQDAVDEDKLNADEELDLDGDTGPLSTDETTAIRGGLEAVAAFGGVRGSRSGHAAA